MRKDFKNLDIYAAFQPVNGAEWQKANGIHADWKTPEHIEVKHVYTKEDLKIETEKIAQKIAQGAPMAIMYMKKMLNKSYANLKDFLDEEALVQTFCLGTEDCKEGILAFKQKRQPNFQGK